MSSLSSSAKLALSLALGAVSAATVLCNLIVIVVFLHRSSLRGLRSNLYIISLAFTDLLTGLVTMPVNLDFLVSDEHGVWRHGRHACVLWLLADTVVCTASVWNLVAIAADRMMALLIAFASQAVVCPVVYMNLRHRSALVTLCGVWTLSLAVCLPQFLFQRVNHELCKMWSDPWYEVYSPLMAFFAPLVLIVVCYCAIAERLWRKMAAKEQRRNLGMELTRLKVTNRALQVPPPAPPSLAPAAILPRENVNCLDPVRGTKSDRHRGGMLVATGTSLMAGAVTTISNLSAANSPVPTRAQTAQPSQQQSSQPQSPQLPQSLQPPQSPQQPLELPQPLQPPQSLLQPPHPPQPPRRLLLDVDRANRQLANNVQKHSASSCSSVPFRAKVQSHRERNVLIQMSVIVLAFVLCWLPFWILFASLSICFRIGTCSYREWMDVLSLVFQWLGYANSLLNPFIYSVFNSEFRRAFGQLCAKVASAVTRRTR